VHGRLLRTEAVARDDTSKVHECEVETK
jgi:hypothetical protein